jgi:hypothetical protein
MTQLWVRATGRRVKVADSPWLDGPIGATDVIGSEHFVNLAESSGLELRVNAPGAGLIADFDELESHAFDTDRVDARIKDFYEHTSAYRLDAWSEWCGVFRPFGRMLAFLFSRRLQQLNVPLAPLATSRGITSDIIQLVEQDTGTVQHTGWLRKFADTQDVIYVGHYSHCVPSRLGVPCVKVVFPLPNGSATVVMKPQVHADGSITIASSGQNYGDAGFYFVLRRGSDSVDVRFVRTMREHIHVYVDEDDTLRADHVFTISGATFLRLHYRMMRQAGR